MGKATYLNGIKVTGGVNMAPDYSTTEYKTGRKWIDGKDIWEITYDFSSSMFSIPSGNNFTSTNIDSSSMETMIDVFANHSDGTVFTDLTTFDPSTDYFYFSGSAEKDDFQIRNGSISRSGGNEGNTQTVTILGDHQTDSDGFRLYYPIYIERDITINDVLCFSTI